MNFFVFYSKWAAIMAIHSNIKVGVEEVHKIRFCSIKKNSDNTLPTTNRGHVPLVPPLINKKNCHLHINLQPNTIAPIAPPLITILTNT